MATHMRNQLKDITEGWSKWHIAACVGAPIALGLAGLWFYRRRTSQDLSGGDTGKVNWKEDAFSKTSTSPAPSSAPPPKMDEPKTPQELAQDAKTKGNRFFKEGRYQDAIQCYTEAIRLCPKNFSTDMSTFYQNRAAAFENLKQYDKVVEDCTEALRFNTRYSKALARRSKAYEVLEKYREAFEDITKACLIEGFSNQSYLQSADRVLKTLGKFRASTEYKTKKPVKPSTFYVENYLAGFVNDPVALKFVPQKVTADDPVNESVVGVKVKHNLEEDQIGDNGAVLLEKPSAFERAKECLSSQEYDQIVSLCDEELKAEPASSHVAEALLLRGTMRLLQGQGDEAVTDLSQLRELQGIAPRLLATALLREGGIQMQREPSDEALQLFVKAAQVDPGNSDVYHHHGQQLLQIEKLDDAITMFEKSIELSPSFPTSYIQKFYAMHRKAIATESQSLMSLAKDGFKSTISLFPDCSDALILYGQALTDQGQFEEAESFFQKACELQPRNANNIVHRGLMLLQWKGEVTTTMELLDKALSVDGTCQYAYEIKGTIEVQRGNLPQAVSCFKKAIALSNSEAEMAHLYSLMETAEVQVKVARDLNLQLPSGMM